MILFWPLIDFSDSDEGETPERWIPRTIWNNGGPWLVQISWSGIARNCVRSVYPIWISKTFRSFTVTFPIQKTLPIGNFFPENASASSGGLLLVVWHPIEVGSCLCKKFIIKKPLQMRLVLFSSFDSWHIWCLLSKIADFKPTLFSLTSKNARLKRKVALLSNQLYHRRSSLNSGYWSL